MEKLNKHNENIIKKESLKNNFESEVNFSELPLEKKIELIKQKLNIISESRKKRPYEELVKDKNTNEILSIWWKKTILYKGYLYELTEKDIKEITKDKSNKYKVDNMNLISYIKMIYSEQKFKKNPMKDKQKEDIFSWWTWIKLFYNLHNNEITALSNIWSWTINPTTAMKAVIDLSLEPKSWVIKTITWHKPTERLTPTERNEVNNYLKKKEIK